MSFQEERKVPIIGVLAVQGAFAEHAAALEKLGAHCVELRCAADAHLPFDGLVLPGGESTVQAKLLRELGMLEPLRARIDAGLPVLATCAGMILLAQEIVQGIGSGGASKCSSQGFATMPIRVMRNAYGRQLGSFRVKAPFGDAGDVPMTFIRAPYIEEAADGVEILSRVDGKVVAARYGNQLALAFHPELDSDTTIHEAFLSMVLQHAVPGSPCERGVRDASN